MTQISDPWRIFPDAKPYTTVSGLAIDRDGNFPILFRGPNVRSAPNIWSLPSGLHEVGLTIEQQFIAELGEELNIIGIEGSYQELGVYENILTEENPKSHWVIHVGIIRVESLETLTNKEPDKHPEMKTVNVGDIERTLNTHGFAPVLDAFLRDHADRIRAITNSVGPLVGI